MIRILIAMILLCSAVDAQSISVSGGRKSMIVSGHASPPLSKDQQREVIAVTTGESEPVILERTDRPGRFSFSGKMPANQSGRYLVVFTSQTCGPCRGFESKELPVIKAAGITPTLVDCTDGNEWGVDRVPQFWIVDKKTQRPVEKIVGYTSAEDLLKMLRESSTCEPEVSVSVTAPAQKPVYASSMSHSEMVALHNRLHGGGSWTWPGDLATHLATVHGVSSAKSTSQSIRVQQSGGCPSGNCPTNRIQRRGFLKGMFR